MSEANGVLRNHYHPSGATIYIEKRLTNQSYRLFSQPLFFCGRLEGQATSGARRQHFPLRRRLPAPGAAFSVAETTSGTRRQHFPLRRRCSCKVMSTIIPSSLYREGFGVDNLNIFSGYPRQNAVGNTWLMYLWTTNCK